MAGNEISKPQNFEEIVRDRVRKVIFDSVPDEQIDNLIKAQYDKLFVGERPTYGNTTNPSTFERMVEGVLMAKIKDKVATFVEAQISGEWNDDIGARVVGEVARKFATVSLESLASRLVSESLQNFRNSLSNNQF